AAAEAGVKAGDVILQVNRKPVGSVGQVKKQVAEVPSGKPLLLLGPCAPWKPWRVLPLAAARAWAEDTERGWRPGAAPRSLGTSPGGRPPRNRLPTAARAGTGRHLARGAPPAPARSVARPRGRAAG